jgi:hypothetical protein
MADAAAIVHMIKYRSRLNYELIIENEIDAMLHCSIE